MPDHNSWPQADVDSLCKLWRTHSAKQIGYMLGRTRSAICGKISRLYREGVLTKQSGKDYVVNPRPPPPPPPPPPQPARFTKAVKANPTWQEIMQSRPAAPVMRPCKLLELRKNRCRWPLGPPLDAATLFCGGRTMPQRPYCPYHSRIAFQPGRTQP
jgi:GcrA cell cycle regulator